MIFLVFYPHNKITQNFALIKLELKNKLEGLN